MESKTHRQKAQMQRKMQHLKIYQDSPSPLLDVSIKLKYTRVSDGPKWWWSKSFLNLSLCIMLGIAKEWTREGLIWGLSRHSGSTCLKGLILDVQFCCYEAETAICVLISGHRLNLPTDEGRTIRGERESQQKPSWKSGEPAELTVEKKDKCVTDC